MAPPTTLTKTRIQAVFRPASVALVGASDRPGSLGEFVRRNLADSGFAGPVYYVNPAHAQVAGQPAYPSVRDLPQAVDLAVIVTPPERVLDVVDACAERGVGGAVVVTSSFHETDASAPSLEPLLRERARRTGLRVLGPGSLGVIRTDDRLNAAAGPGLPAKGRLALVSQSSAVCAAILDWAQQRHVGFSTVISTGAAADLGFGQVLDFLVRDPATDSIMLYMESIDDARRFMSALRAAARVKPVVVMKAARHLATTDGADVDGASHLAGDDVFDAAMRRAGVLRIHEFHDFFTATATLGSGVRVAGRRIAIVANAGGPGTLAADRVTDRALQLAQFAAPTREQLGQVLPPGTPPANPALLRGEVTAAQFAAAAGLCLADPGVDALVAIFAPHVQDDPHEFAAALIDTVRGTRKPVFTCWMGGDTVASSRGLLAEHKVPSYTTPEAAVDAIAALALYAANQELLLQVPQPLADASTPDQAGARAIIERALATGRDSLTDVEARDVLGAFGIPVRGPGATPGPGRPLDVRVTRDPVFGPAIGFGLGGTLAAIIHDRASALPPLNRYLARDLIRRTRAGQALDALPGIPAADETAVEDVLLRVSELVCELPEIVQLQLNPLLANEHGAFVTAARIGVRPRPATARPYQHMAIHPYPSSLIQSLELQGGVTATIRPIRPEDAAIEHEFVHGLSEQSKFLRFMFALHDLAPTMLSRFTQIDYDRELALIGVVDTPDGERQIGVARYITLEDEATCEFAIVVGDEWQGKGLARRLFGALIDAARHTTLTVMNGVTLRENVRMLELARANGFRLRTDPDDPALVQMILELRPVASGQGNA